MSSTFNQTADAIFDLVRLDKLGLNAATLGAGVFLFSLPCIAVYRAFLQTTASDNAICARKAKPDQKCGMDNTQKIRVSRLLIHPIKSCRGISVQEVRYTPEGLENDRAWAIADADTNAIITARDHPRMVLITPTIHPDPTSPHGGILLISFPDDSGCPSLRIPLAPSREVLENWQELNDVTLFRNQGINCYVCAGISVNDPSPSAVLSNFLGKSVNLLYKGTRPRLCKPTTTFPELNGPLRLQDGYPLLILSEESMDAIDGEIKNYIGQQGVNEVWKQKKIVIERFRPNIVVSGAGPFAEDMWEEIFINSSTTSTSEPVKFSLVSRCTRCLLPNVDNNTGVRDEAVPYKVLMKFRIGLEPREKFKPCVGCNAVARGSGVLKIGDGVTVWQLRQE